ncbi:DUF456 domain-containing protein [Gephyromycinifex aptenodytis]|uniref:DUF456 domain-containing protein n=1 Tax=Gephyromycinifex aptenodytis TaxID=2716227 RepID=UPI0014478BB0|nr:DUF456 domain-containing protein [Gephyromycinifex aptenodytis]
MLIAVTILAALAIAVGLVGIVIPVLPGLIVVLGAVVVWALVAQQAAGWTVLIVSVALALAGWVLQYIIPGRQLKSFGIPNSTTIVGIIAGIIGFFVIPFIGLPVGFVLGVFGAEYRRLKSPQEAWPSAVRALKAAAMSYGIELTTALLIAVVFAAGSWAVFTSAFGTP